MRYSSKPKQRVLVVGGDSVGRIAPLLESPNCRVERVEDGPTTQLLTRKMAFSHIVVGYPLPGLDVEHLIRDLRRVDSASPTARLLLLTTDEHLERLDGWRDEGLIAGALSIERPDEEIVVALKTFLTTSPRVAERVPVRLAVVGSTRESCLGETINLSETGMLVRCDAKLPDGTRVEVELEPRRSGEPIRAMAVVVRTVDEKSEGLAGVGLQFVDFAADGRDRLAVRIRGFLAEHVG